MNQPLFLSVKTVAAVVVGCLTLSGLYWRNALDIARLRDELRALETRIVQTEKESRELLVRVSLLEDGTKGHK